MISYNIYKIYSSDSLNEKKVFKWTCLFATILSVALIIFTQLILTINENVVKEKIYRTNGGQIKVQNKEYLKEDFNEQILKELDRIADDIDFRYILCKNINTNIIANNKADSIALLILNRFDIPESFKLKEITSTNQIVLSRVSADRLNVRVGDKVFLKLHSYGYKDTYFQVVKILDDKGGFSTAGSEAEFGDEILGNGYVILPEYETFNVAFINNMKINENNIDSLKKIFEPGFEIRTLQSLSAEVTPRINLQMGFIKLIGVVTLIISCICMCWTFTVFIMDRKRDFILFKILGMQPFEIAKMILMEILAVMVPGLILGIITGIAGTIVYLRSQGMQFDVLSIDLLRISLYTIIMVVAESSVFAIIPISMLNNLSYTEEFHGEQESKTGINLIKLFAVISIAIILSVVYIKEGIIFSFVFIIAFFIFYLPLKVGVHVLGRLKSRLLNIYFLSFYNISEYYSINVFCHTVLNMTIVFSFCLIYLLPTFLGGLFEVDNGKYDVRYITKSVSECKADDFFQAEQIRYSKFYPVEVKVEFVNGTKIKEHLKNSKIAQEYMSEVQKNFEDRILELHSNEADMSESLLGERSGIVINNVYRNVIDFKENSIITLKIGEKLKDYKVTGVQSSKDMDIIGYISDNPENIKKLLKDNKDYTVIYKIQEKVSDKLLARIVKDDKNGYLEKNTDLNQYFLTYVEDQKAIILNNIVVVGFSSCFLVFLGQIILFLKKKNTYRILELVGMDKTKFLKIEFMEKLVISFAQVIVVSFFLEPLRFLILAEVSNKPYSLSLKLLLIELGLFFIINIAPIVEVMMKNTGFNCEDKSY